MLHRFLDMTLALILSLVLASAVSAQVPIGIRSNDPGGPLPSGPFIGHPPDTMVNVTAPVSKIYPYPIYTWDKTFVWDYSSSSISPGNQLCIMETVPLLFPSTVPIKEIRPLTGWHETIVSTDLDIPMVWTLTGLSVTAGGVPVGGLTPTLSPDGKELTLQFDPITIPIDPFSVSQTPPLVFSITKYIAYSGDTVISSGAQTQIAINVSDQATTAPEPSSFVLAGIASCGLIAYACRRETARK